MFEGIMVIVLMNGQLVPLQLPAREFESMAACQKHMRSMENKALKMPYVLEAEGDCKTDGIAL